MNQQAGLGILQIDGKAMWTIDFLSLKSRVFPFRLVKSPVFVYKI